MTTPNQISNTIWNVANHLRGSWKNYEYQDVILPLTVLKRLDAALEPTKQKTLERFNELDGKVTDLRIIRRVTGYDFIISHRLPLKNFLMIRNMWRVTYESILMAFPIMLRRSSPNLILKNNSNDLRVQTFFT